jgi:hypothetical protein
MANATGNPAEKADLFDVERRWIALARICELEGGSESDLKIS